ncbi:hypothetical protein L1887_44450 [Cichorium endivia]|nr:hypothetical protein L1887_44450 [Cichorium endivia]
MEGRTQRKKTLDKSNSKKHWSFRPSNRSPQSSSLSLPDDRSATTNHPSPVKVSDASPLSSLTSPSLRTMLRRGSNAGMQSDHKQMKFQTLGVHASRSINQDIMSVYRNQDH